MGHDVQHATHIPIMARHDMADITEVNKKKKMEKPTID